MIEPNCHIGGNKMLEVQEGSYIEFDYINWKGAKGHRKVKVNCIYYGATSYHPEEQWLLQAIDIDKGRERIFAMKDITNVSQW
jgi:hypothetical protein